MSDDGYGYDYDDGYGHDDGGDYSYDEHYDDGESYDTGERDTEDYTRDSARSSFNEDDSRSYDYGTGGASSEGDGPQDADGYPQEELEVGSGEVTCSSGNSSDGRLQEEAESSYRRAPSPSGVYDVVATLKRAINIGIYAVVNSSTP
ncbi:hypothetical protein EMPG_14922 [Blastomyces silverae]|uniref:Uncharacterized protein n=1 Tax=Blastomyces silverae TaxID=2060906 RepID=A0A0H1BDW0_9EURO|nr:hypothetical protein EMPG_14922 [Blastomyces silverae]